MIVRKVGAFGLLAASFLVAYFVVRYQPHVAREIRSIGGFALPIATLIFALVASAPFSVTDALAIMNGSVFGPIEGSLVDIVGLVLAALLGYWINRRASHMFELERYLEKLPAWVKRFPVGSPAFLMAVRIIPGLGGTVATASAAAFRVPVWVHVWTMCAVAVPLCVLLTVFGDRATVFVHRYETRARQYYEHHRPHFHFHHVRATMAPVATP